MEISGAALLNPWGESSEGNTDVVNNRGPVPVFLSLQRDKR